LSYLYLLIYLNTNIFDNCFTNYYFIAVCENCGAIGVKHSFYTKLRNYCSQACVKAALEKSEIFLNEHKKKNKFL